MKSCVMHALHPFFVTNRELARRLGISEQQISKFVNHRTEPSLQRLHQIADVLNLRVKDLFEPVG